MIIVITILIYHINELFSCKISEKKFTSEQWIYGLYSAMLQTLWFSDILFTFKALTLLARLKCSELIFAKSMENIFEKHSVSLDNLGWEEDHRVALPGFGFFPPRVVELLHFYTAVINVWENRKHFNTNIICKKPSNSPDFSCKLLIRLIEKKLFYPHLQREAAS